MWFELSIYLGGGLGGGRDGLGSDAGVGGLGVGVGRFAVEHILKVLTKLGAILGSLNGSTLLHFW